jgi:hypothetical protein
MDSPCPTVHDSSYHSTVVGTPKSLVVLAADQSVGWKSGGEEVQRTVNHLIRLSVLKLILPEYGLVGPDLAVYEDYCMSAGDDGGCGMGETYFQPLTVQIPSEGNVSDPLDDIGTVLRITEAMTFAPSGSRT